MPVLPHRYSPVTADFLHDAPLHVVAERAIPCTPERLFELFEDPRTWIDGMGLPRLEWESPKPFGPGTCRIAQFGAVVVRERFVAWEPCRRLAFFCEAGTTPVLDAFFEDYRVTRAPSDPGACIVTWQVAARFRGPLAPWLAPPLTLAFRLQAPRTLTRLASFVAAHPSAHAQTR